MPAASGAGASRQLDPGLEQLPQLSVSPVLFQKFQKLIYAETGIWLGNSKTALLCGRLFRRLRALGITSLETYYERVSQPDQQEERASMIDAITTNETRFFREPRQFEFLVQKVLPRWRAEAEHRVRPKRVRIWSAGCSSGEEPYSAGHVVGQPPPRRARLGRSPSRHRHLQPRARKSVPGNLSHHQIAGITRRTCSTLLCCAERLTGKPK